MKRRDFLKVGFAGAIAAGCATTAPFAAGQAGGRPPNFVVIFADDQGYGDLGVYGAEALNTPHWDAMAAEGMTFTDFYVSAPVCTPSRASLMTGCYPARVSMDTFPEIPGTPVPHDRVIFPPQPFGLHPDEITVARLLREHGYRTACIGKWHLGHHEPFWPTRHGFEYFYGTPYSNDMVPSVLMRNEQIIEEPVDQDTITERYTQEAKAFISAHQSEPFFLYLPHNMPHTPLHVGDRFRGRSARGLYGDVIEMLDWSTGEILGHIRQLGLAEDTLVIFTSDNGPVRRFGEERGRVGPLRGGKGNTFEGGMRVPGIFWWPGRIPAGSVCRAMATTMDLLPTFARLAGVEPPRDRKIDGHDIRPLLYGESDQTPYHVLYYYRGGELIAARSGPWKLVVEHPVEYEHRYGTVPEDARPEEALFNLDDDIGEENNVIGEYPEIAAALTERLDEARRTLGDTRLGYPGAERRPLGVYQQAGKSALLPAMVRRSPIAGRA